MRVKNIGFWIILFSIITLIFFPAIIYPFFQDDFFALVTTKITSLGDIWRLFLPVAEAVYWRPLGIQLYFGLMQFFGLGQPIWFHLVSLLVHLLNTYLVYRLIRSLRATGGSVAISRIAKLTAFLWGTSPIHFFALGWAVNFSFILVVTWPILGAGIKIMSCRADKRDVIGGVKTSRNYNTQASLLPPTLKDYVLSDL